MLHGSLGIARHDVRQNPCPARFSGKRTDRTDILKNFLRSCHIESTDTPGRPQKVFGICCASVRISSRPCPARVYGERHTVRWSATRVCRKQPQENNGKLDLWPSWRGLLGKSTQQDQLVAALIKMQHKIRRQHSANRKSIRRFLQKSHMP